MNNKTELQTELNELQASIKSAADRADEIQKLLTEPEKWKAPVGNYAVQGNGFITPFSNENYAPFGTSYATKEQAEKARAMMKPMHIMIAYKMAHCPDDEPDWEDRYQEKYYPSYGHISEIWQISSNTTNESPCEVYFTNKKIAQGLVDKLNANLIEGVEL